MNTYVRFRIDASIDLGSDRLHTASDRVPEEWHDTAEEAVEAAVVLFKEDNELILSVGEYWIDAEEDPSDEDWHRLTSHAPMREISAHAR